MTECALCGQQTTTPGCTEADLAHAIALNMIGVLGLFCAELGIDFDTPETQRAAHAAVKHVEVKQ